MLFCSEDDEEADIQFESSGFISAMQEMFGEYPYLYCIYQNVVYEST